MTRRSLLMILSGLAILQACNQEPDYKSVREDVIKVHDQLMADDEKVISAKMKLDTLALTGLPKLKVQQPALDTAKVRAEINRLTGKLTAANDSMSFWMQNFKPDMGGKSNTEAVAYFTNEKIKVHKLDSVYKTLLKESDEYLKRFNVKVDVPAEGHEHHMH